MEARILITIKIEKAIRVKSIIDCKNVPHLITACPTENDFPEISMPPSIRPMTGIIIPSTRDETILPNAAPITTATARSITLPRMANALNSDRNDIHFSPFKSVFVYTSAHAIEAYFQTFVKLIIVLVNYMITTSNEDTNMHWIAEHYFKACEKFDLNPIALEKELEGFAVKIGHHAYYFRQGLTPFNATVSVSIACNKYSTNKLLEKAGIPVPKAYGLTLENYRYNKSKLKKLKLKYPLVVKPAWDSACGFNVICNIQNYKELNLYIEKNIRSQKCINIEEFHPNLRSYRVLVFYDKIIGVVERFPACVIGDGKSSIRQLIKEQNKIRKVLKKKIPTGPINVNTETYKLLAEAGLTLNSIPNKDQTVPLRYICNSTHGGTFKSLDTSVICPENADLAIRAARVLDLNLVGFDVICKDIGVPIEKSEGYFIEANADPDITIHEESFGGIKNMVSEKIVMKLIKHHPIAYIIKRLNSSSPWAFLIRLSLLITTLIVLFLFLKWLSIN